MTDGLWVTGAFVDGGVRLNRDVLPLSLRAPRTPEGSGGRGARQGAGGFDYGPVLGPEHNDLVYMLQWMQFQKPGG